MRFRFTPRRLAAFTIAAWFVAPAITARADISYTVRVPTTGKQLRVEISVPVEEGKPVALQIPTWAPGAYMLGNYANNVVDVAATGDKGNVLSVTHPDKITWRVEAEGSRVVKLTYALNGADIGERSGAVHRAHVSGPRTYMYVVDRKTEKARLTLQVPNGWKVICPLESKGGKLLPDTNVQERYYDAPDYDWLADSPVEMGDYRAETYSTRGVPHHVVMYGDYAHVDVPKFVEMCKKISDIETTFFNDVPFKQYVFFFRFGGPNGRGGGGLEHLASTEIGLAGPVDDGVRSLIAHEYFHLWNVKRIRPFVLGPFDYTGPVQTNNLWWSEGVTSYYGDILSRRGGMNTDEEYFKHLGQVIGQLQGSPARLKVTLEESSFKVFDGGGSQGFGNLSYYVKGELAGVCLDLKIRQLTNGKRSLDDVIKALYIKCGKGKKPGFAEDEILTTASRVAGQDLSDFYRRICRSTEEMPLDECLGYAGLMAARAAKPIVTGNTGLFGELDRQSGVITVRFLLPNGAAAKSGLKQGDKIMQIDGEQAGKVSRSLLREPKAGAQMRLSIEREGMPMEIILTVGTDERYPYTVAPISNASPYQIQMRTAWLNGSSK